MSNLYLIALIYTAGVLAYILVDNIHFRWYMNKRYGIPIESNYWVAPGRSGLLYRLRRTLRSSVP